MRRALQLASAAVLLAAPVWAQAPSRKIGELELQLLGIQASADPANPTVPKNIASAIRVVVSGGGKVLDAAEVASFLSAAGENGAPIFLAEAELSGPGLRQTITIPQRLPGDELPADPLLLALPALSVAGDYTISNLRLVVGSKTVLDVQPQRIPLKVIDQILVTSVKTRPLTMDEIREKGIVLDSDDYLGFDFALGLKLESTVVNVSFPVVFDRQGVVVPQPPDPTGELGVNRGTAKAPVTVADAVSILPVMMTAIPEDENAGQAAPPLTLYQGQPVRIPSVLVIPGNVGYLKQFFSAQLFVANGAPAGAPLTVRDVTGKIKLPKGADEARGGDNVPGSDDPLVLATTVKGPHPETLPVRGLGPDGEPDTSDDVDSFGPGEQGRAEFVLRGDKEGFHNIDIDIRAVLDGLPVGPVKIGGKAQGGVLVRNPRFDVSFTVPSTVRRNEKFKVFMTISNVGQGVANGLYVTPDNEALAGATLLTALESCPPPDGPDGVCVPPIAPGQSRVVTFEFKSLTTGAVVASYLGFDEGTSGDVTGSLKFKVGVGERGVPLSPDTLALPASLEKLPADLVEVAMRVLGQAWSLAGAPAGSLPPGVTRTSRAVVQQKALALAEAGLRMELGESLHAAVNDLVADFFSPRELDPGFDQLLRQTEAGRDLARALGKALAESADPPVGPLDAEQALAKLLASGSDFISFAADTPAPAELTVTDRLGRKLATNRSPDAIGTSAIAGGVLLPLGPPAEAPFVGVLAQPLASPYTIEVKSGAQLSVTLPRGDGSLVRAVVTCGYPVRVTVDLAQPDRLSVEDDPDGDGTFETRPPVATTPLDVPGPSLLSASLIGPESFAGASQFGTNFALLFDRPVDATAAATASNYQVPDNQVLAAKRQLTGRLVFGTLAYPEGPHLETTISVSGLDDERGRPGTSAIKPLKSRFDPEAGGGGVVIGRVVNSDGTPASAGTIFYTNSSDAQCDLGASPTTVAAIPLDEEAAYQIRYVSRNKCNVPFELAYQDPRTGGLRRVSGQVRYDGERIVMDIALIGRGSVTGIVRGLNLLPAPGATVAVLSATDAATNTVVVADGEGRYLASGLAVGAVSVKAGQGLGLGFAAGRIERSGTTATVDVTLDTGAAAKVTGTVSRVENGQATPQAGELLSYLVQGAIVGYAYSGLDGTFAFENMPAGAFQIRARGGFASGVPGQTEVNVLIHAQPPGAVLGTVRGTVVLPDNTPASRAIVAKDVSSFMIDGGVALGPGGSFEFPGITVGVDASLSAITMDRKRTGTATFHIPANANPPVLEGVVIKLSGVGDVEFTVFDPNGNKLPNVEVALVNPGGPLTVGACAHPCGCRAALTDQQGRVSWEDMPLGRVTAQATRRGAGFFDVVRGTASVTRDGEPGVGVLRFAGTGIVKGKVNYPPGTIAGGGEVTLSSNVFRNDGAMFCGLTPEVSHRAQIDLAGNFRFTGVNLGPVFVTASSPFFPTQVSASGTLTENGQELPLELTFVNTMADKLTGTIFLPDGLTAAGPGVEVTADGASLQNVTVRTNAEGKYRFEAVLPAGTYTVTARDPDTGSVARGTVYLAVSRAASLDLRLKSRGVVRVRVVDGADDPVDKAFVKLTETEFPNKSYEAAIEPANQGVAVFDRVFEGPFSVEAKGPTTGGRASSILPRVAGSSVEVKVRLAVTGTVRGTFRYPDESPVPFGLVTLKSGGRVLGQMTTPGRVKPPEQEPEAEALEELGLGEFIFHFVPGGAFRLEAEDPLTTRTGFAVGSIVGPGKTETVDVVAQGLGTVQGTITGNGKLWDEGARVTVVSGTFRATTFADGNGHYLIEGVPEGRVDVTAAPSEGFLTGTASKTLKGDGTPLTIDVALRDSGTLKGRVVMPDGETQAPPSIVSISVGGVGGGNQSAATDPDGSFQFDRVPAGRATLLVDVVGSIDLARMTVEVPPADTADVTVPLNGIGAIAGQAKGSDGQPIAGQVLLTGTGAFPWSQTMAVAANGTFAVHEALAGPFTASLTVDGGTFKLYGKASGTVSPGETAPITVQVQPSGVVKGVVRKADGTTPAKGAEVTLELDGGGGSVLLYAGGDGAFEALGVPVGVFTVRVYDPVTNGRVVVPPPTAVDSNGDVVDLGTLVLDESAPTLHFLEPQEGITRGRFAGPLELDLGDPADLADLDPDSLRIHYPSGAVLGGLVVAGNRATVALSVSNLKVGKNVLRARAKDRTGNESEAVVSFTLTGGTIHGQVLFADGQPPGAERFVPVQIQGFQPFDADADGSFSKSGVPPGLYSVTATDPETGFKKSEIANLLDGENQSVLVQIRLPAYGTIDGTVQNANGSAAFGVTVKLGSSEATTGEGGKFGFPNVAVDVDHFLFALALPGRDKGSATVKLLKHGEVAKPKIVLNGVGTVEVLVETAGGAPSHGATVLLTSSAGSTDSLPTDELGKVSFSDVLAGNLRAVATDARGATGEATGPLLAGGTAQLEVTLKSVARVKGQVFRHDGSVAPFVTVDISGAKTASTETDGAGNFAFDNVTAGHFDLVARETATGDRGHAEGDVVAGDEGQAVTKNVTFIGTGVVEATVRDGGNQPVKDAQVDVWWTGRFPATRSAFTNENGLAIVTNVLAGSASASARKGFLTTPVVTVPVPAGGSVPVTLQLEGTATARGVVKEPDGTPASGVRVVIGGEFVITAEDGVYEFPDRRLHVQYSLFASRNDRLRAVGSVTLTEHGQVDGPDLTLVGVGTVTGKLRDAAGSAVLNHPVTLTSLVPLFGGAPVTLKTNLQGEYTFSDVPVGGAPVGFTLLSVRGSDRADAEGKVEFHGQPVTRDLKFLPSAVTLPWSMYDANGWLHTMPNADGRLDAASLCITFGGGGALRLSLVHEGTTLPFAGTGNTVPTEENKRELVFRQTLAGLEVTRKLFVPRFGYFARALDILKNDGDQPVSLTVVHETHSNAWLPDVVGSSSGDSQGSSADRWAVLDDAVDGGSRNSCQFPALAFAFGGTEAATPTVEHEKTPSTARFTTRWPLTVPAHGSVALLQALSPQTTRTRGTATAERLTGLPPELLEGLTAEEAQAIVNFAVPADLTSSLPPLPPLDGEVSGRILSGDGTTLVPGASGTFESRSPHYNLPLTINAHDGTFRVAADLAQAHFPRVVPREAFDIEVSYTGVSVPFTAEAEGAFAPGQQFVTQDLSFEGSGVVEGSVLRSDESAVTGATVRIVGPSGPQIALPSSGGAPERFRFPVVAPGAAGSYTLTATHPLGGVTAVANDFVVTAGQKTVRDLKFVPFGTLSGTVRSAGGSPAGALMTLTSPNGFSRIVGSTGSYAFAELPADTYTLTAQDNRNSATVSQQVPVSAGTENTANVTLPPLGSIRVKATVGGEPLVGGRASWQSEARGPAFVGLCVTLSSGECLLDKVSGPSVRVRVEYPGVPDSYGEVTVPLTGEGQSPDANVSVPGVGTVTGFIRARNGAVLPSPSSAIVTLYHATTPTVLKSGVVTDAAGRYTFTNVPVGPFRIRVWRDGFNSKGEAAGSVTAHGTTVELDVVEPRGVLGGPGQAEMWQLAYAVGEQGNLRVDGMPIAGSTPLAEPTVEVFGPGGALVARHDGSSQFAGMSFTAAEAGTHVVVVSTKAAAGGGYSLGSVLQNETHVFRVYDGPTLTARVTRHDDGAPVSGQALELTLPNAVEIAATTGADGRYMAPLFGTGTAVAQAYDQEDILIGRAETVVVAEESATLDVSVPARGQVQVLVRIGVQKLPGLDVTFTSNHAAAFEGDRIRTRTTGSLGADLGVARAVLPAGTIVARAQNPADAQPHEVSGVLAPDGTLALELVFPADTAGTLRGVVRGRLGAVAIAGATVEIPGVPAVTTDSAGAYRFDGLAVGPYSVTARHGSASQNLLVNVADTPVFQDFELPLDSLGGRIKEPDGTGAAASVLICSRQSPFFFQVCSSTTSADDGTYLLHGIPGDDTFVSLTATLTDGSGLQAFANTSRPTGLGTLDATLPLTGSIVGVVREADGQLVANRSVQLQRSNKSFLRWGSTDSEGRFRFPHVTQQHIRLLATAADGIPGEAVGLVVNGQELTLDVTLMATGTLHGRLVDPAQQPLAGRTYSVQALEAIEPFMVFAQLDAAGEFTRRVPIGPYRLMFVYASDPPAAYEGMIEAGVEEEATATAGSHLWLANHPLGGPLGNFKYDSSCPATPCVAIPRMIVTGASQSDYASTELEGRGLRYLLESRNRVRHRQVTYVPPSGAFARSLLLLTNPTNVPLTVEVEDRLPGFYSYSVATTSDGNAFASQTDAYVVARRTTTGSEGDIALVTGNLLPVNWWVGVSGGLRAFMTVTLGPGETRSLLSFSATRTQADQAALIAQAAALANLSDPEALFGLTDAEKFSIVNFAMPGTEKVSVNVTRMGQPIWGAFVSFESAREDVPVEFRSRSAETVGGLASAWLPAGDVTARVTDPHFGTLVTASGTLVLGTPLTLPVTLTALPRVWLNGATGFDGAGSGSGYAFRCEGSITGFELMVDGQPFPATFITGVPRPDVRSAFQGECPSLGNDAGYQFSFDANQLSVGLHTLFVRATDDLGGLTNTPATQINVTRMVRSALERPDRPVADTETVEGGGWAFVCTRTISSYALLVNGLEIPEATFTTSSRPEIAGFYRGACPSLPDAIGFEFSVPAERLAAGVHFAQVRFVDSAGGTHFTGTLFIAIDPALRHTGTLQIRYFNGSEEQGQFVCVEALEAPRLDPGSPWQACLSTNGEGQPPVSVRVPIGAYRVLFTQEDPPAAVEGVLQEDETQDVRLQAGSHIFRSNGPAGPFVAPGIAGVDAFSDVVKPELDGRATRSLIAAGAGLRVRRQEFAPESGAFTRTLTLVSNPGSEPVTVDVGSSLALGPPDWDLQATSDLDTALELTDSSAVAVRVSRALVNGDPSGGDPEGTARGIVIGSALAPTAFTFFAGSVENNSEVGDSVNPAAFQVTHALTIPPGETRAILAFAVHGADLAEATARAQALADLSDPQALLGLSALERSAIVNFTMPPTGQVAGVVKTASLEPVANAPVGALGGGALIAETVTDALGNYSLTLDVGDYALVAFDPSTNRPGRRLVTVVENAQQAADIVLLSDAEVGTVRVLGPIGDGEEVRVEAAGYWPFWHASATFSGEATIGGVPAGSVTVRVVSQPSLQAQGELAPGGLLELTLVLVGNGSITGLVLDTDAGPIANARVAAFGGDPWGKLAEVVADADGYYVITGLPEGWYFVAAIHPENRLSGSGEVFVPDGGTGNLDIVIQDEGATATVTVRGVIDATGLPAVGETVTLESYRYPGFWVYQAPLDENGLAVFANVPADEEVRASAGVPPDRVQEIGYLYPGGTLEITLRIGEARRAFPVDLSAAGDLSYFAWPTTVEANTNGPWTCDPFCAGYSYGSSANGTVFASERAESVAWREGVEGREATIREWSTGGLRASKRIFVPASGGFVRILDVFENTTLAEMTVYAYFDHRSYASGSAWSIGTTSAGGDATFDLSDAYATMTNTLGDRPELAWVISGPNGAFSRSSTVAYQNDDGSFSYVILTADGSFVLGPGQKAILMRFTVQRPHGQTDEVQTLALALHTLDASVRDAALAMIDPLDWPFVINFAIQP